MKVAPAAGQEKTIGELYLEEGMRARLYSPVTFAQAKTLLGRGNPIELMVDQDATARYIIEANRKLAEVLGLDWRNGRKESPAHTRRNIANAALRHGLERREYPEAWSFAGRLLDRCLESEYEQTGGLLLRRGFLTETRAVFRREGGYDREIRYRLVARREYAFKHWFRSR
ncbi:MAG: hypothetical protein HYW25_04505 [Candidatus Aenigmarchaeota archaeon]|nr:hypothetical protein [Candidatus Aenigmarchaeota archaeon]